MKITQISLFALAFGAAPFSVQAGVDIGINIGGPEIVVRSQPPPERYEGVPMAPGPGYAWIRGHWVWHHERWEWKGGYYERVSHPGSVWIGGQWVARGNGWVWVEGHYSMPPPPPVYGPPPGEDVVIEQEPPAPMVEVIPGAPGPDYFWIGGHWGWSGGRWSWVHGRYDRHPHFHPGGGWEAGHWDRRGGGWAWHEGHWR